MSQDENVRGLTENLEKVGILKFELWLHTDYI